jgi:hypothetical protein
LDGAIQSDLCQLANKLIRRIATPHFGGLELWVLTISSI